MVKSIIYYLMSEDERGAVPAPRWIGYAVFLIIFTLILFAGFIEDPYITEGMTK